MPSLAFTSHPAPTRRLQTPACAAAFVPACSGWRAESRADGSIGAASCPARAPAPGRLSFREHEAARRTSVPRPRPGLPSGRVRGCARRLHRRVARASQSAQTRRAYVSKVRTYLAWLDTADVDGDPLTDPGHPGLGAATHRQQRPGRRRRVLHPRRPRPARAERLDLPTVAPRALTGQAVLRWLRASTHRRCSSTARSGRLGTRGASAIVAAILDAAGLDDGTDHILAGRKCWRRPRVSTAAPDDYTTGRSWTRWPPAQTGGRWAASSDCTHRPRSTDTPTSTGTPPPGSQPQIWTHCSLRSWSANQSNRRCRSGSGHRPNSVHT